MTARAWGPAAALALLALVAPLLAGSAPIVSMGGWQLRPPVAHDPLAIDLSARLQGPGRTPWLGTDELGRDALSRLIHAAPERLQASCHVRKATSAAHVEMAAASSA